MMMARWCWSRRRCRGSITATDSSATCILPTRQFRAEGSAPRRCLRWLILQHALPKHFRRARNFGFLHPVPAPKLQAPDRAVALAAEVQSRPTCQHHPQATPCDPMSLLWSCDGHRDNEAPLPDADALHRTHAVPRNRLIVSITDRHRATQGLQRPKAEASARSPFTSQRRYPRPNAERSRTGTIQPPV